MKANELKIRLKESTKKELEKVLVDLFRKNEFVRDYCSLKYEDESRRSILAKHKEIIENEFFPQNGFGQARLSVAKKAITEFKKISMDKDSIAELMIFYVENGVTYTDCYGDINEQFYLSMEGMYERAIKFITDNNLVAKYNDRCLNVLRDTENMGWGFHDQLCEIYHGYIGEQQA